MAYQPWGFAFNRNTCTGDRDHRTHIKLRKSTGLEVQERTYSSSCEMTNELRGIGSFNASPHSMQVSPHPFRPLSAPLLSTSLLSGPHLVYSSVFREFMRTYTS
jgi:hypothetical protein